MLYGGHNCFVRVGDCLRGEITPSIRSVNWRYCHDTLKFIHSLGIQASDNYTMWLSYASVPYQADTHYVDSGAHLHCLLTATCSQRTYTYSPCGIELRPHVGQTPNQPRGYVLLMPIHHLEKNTSRGGNACNSCLSLSCSDTVDRHK